MPGFRTGFTKESLKPLGNLGRELEEKINLPKGMIAKSTWEKRKIKGSVQRGK